MDDDGETKSYREVAELERQKRVSMIEDIFGAPDPLSQNPEQKPAPQSENSGAASYPKPTNVHEGHRQRLRRALRYDAGLDSLSDVGLIETLLSFLIPRVDVNPIAHALIEKFESVLGVLSATADELVTVQGMTRSAAEVVSGLSSLNIWGSSGEIRIVTHADAANFFSSLYRGGNCGGTYAAYLDGGFRLFATEKYEGRRLIPLAKIVASVSRYAARYVIISRLESEIISGKFALIEDVRSAAQTLELVGAKLIDCLLFTDYGYYTPGAALAAGTTAEFSIMPLYAFSYSPELSRKLGEEAPDSEDGGLFAEREYADTFAP